MTSLHATRQDSLFKRNQIANVQQDSINEDEDFEEPIIKIDLDDEDDVKVDNQILSLQIGSNQDTNTQQIPAIKSKRAIPLDNKQQAKQNIKHHQRELPEEHMCDCSICESQNRKISESLNEDLHYEDSSINDHFGIVDEKKMKYRQDFPYEKEEKPQEKDYSFILTRLQPIKKGNRTLRLYVPETILFVQGEAKLLIYTHKDKMMRFIKQKEKLNLQELRKFMNKKRYKYRYLLDNLELRQQQQQQIQQNNYVNFKADVTGNNSQDLIKKKNKNQGSVNNSHQNITMALNPAQQQQNREEMIKEKDNREAVIIKYDIEVEQKRNNEGNYVNVIQNQVQNNQNAANFNSNQQPNQNQMQISNFQVNQIKKQLSLLPDKANKPFSHKGTLTLNQPQQSQNLNQQTQANTIVNYQQFNQVLNELEFLNLMMKRKIDPVWSSILFIQNYMKVKRRNMEYIKVKFRYEEDQWHPLFNRALNEIQIINGEISQASQDYISQEQEQEFEERLVKQNLETYIKYMCFKMFHYIEVFFSSKITRMRTEWMIDDFGHIYFMNAYKVKHQPRSKIALSSEMYMKKLELVAEKKLSENATLENHYLSIQKKQIFDIFTDMLFKEHEKTNKSLQKDEVKKQIKDNLTRIYQGRKQEPDYQIPPNIVQGFLKVIKSEQPVQEFKKFIFNQNPQQKPSSSINLKKVQKKISTDRSGQGNNQLTSSSNLNKQISDKSILRTSASQNFYISGNKSVFNLAQSDEAYQDMNFKIPSLKESKNMPLTLTYKVRKEQSNLNRVKIQNKVFDQLQVSPLFSKSRFVQNYPQIDFADDKKRTLPSLLYAQEIKKINSGNGKFHLKNFRILQSQ
ncbi:hypothetical protein TTHERM_00899400 (macronuclear) [Tetrahymena thermophila SB210]|uniref:Uncharacterized protein n=1 Tax=Tetrahymena thermophila (strain SB210) TaxID=312017 RepID=Q23YC3_TETTS|nr:hypothetical protein TTHERM_00899400 [Tetrahymena thermophila SB210]EAS01541.2 hypothetical protein TTHERM_00899400 [Tetrahymena thermophila SB210]|eukprot:XP_001021786.2 hypothetical protein TTHERM_00899400 [Tetrahymena thermophila SB210]